MLLWWVLGLAVAQAAVADVLVREGYVRGLPPGQPTTAAFMRLLNRGEVAVTINRVESDSSERAEFHAHRHSDGLMRMERIEQVKIPPGGEFILAPGDHHLMLINLHKALREGDEVAITLSTAQGDSYSVVLPVRSVLNEHRHH